MIQVREVFQVQFGRAREAAALAQEMVRVEEEHGGITGTRMLTDLTGDYYQLVLEQEFESLAAFEEALARGMSAPEFREIYPRFAALITGGRREIYRIVQSPAPPRIDSTLVGERVVTG